jgi:hypothetical protein
MLPLSSFNNLAIFPTDNHRFQNSNDENYLLVFDREKYGLEADLRLEICGKMVFLRKTYFFLYSQNKIVCERTRGKECLGKVLTPRFSFATSTDGLRRQRRCPLVTPPSTREVVAFLPQVPHGR